MLKNIYSQCLELINPRLLIEDWTLKPATDNRTCGIQSASEVTWLKKNIYHAINLAINLYCDISKVPTNGILIYFIFF